MGDMFIIINDVSCITHRYEEDAVAVLNTHQSIYSIINRPYNDDVSVVLFNRRVHIRCRYASYT